MSRPPLFSKFGKNVKDLLTKKYDFSNQVVVKNKLHPDVALENTVTFGNELGSLSGKVKATHTCKNYGETEVEVDTAGNASVEYATLPLAKHPELGFATAFVFGPTQDKNGFGNKSSVEFVNENVAASASYEYASSHFVESSLVTGFDGLAVGGNVKFDAGSNTVADFNFGTQYSTKDYTATLKTERKADVLQASFHHNVPSTGPLKTQIGAQFSYDLADSLRTLAVGLEHDVDATTGLKAKVSTDGVFATVIEHKLSNPNLKVAFSSTWGESGKTPSKTVPCKCVKPSKFGVSLTFGDY